ncbi:S1-like domain-containing RNA-binding protein [Pseudomonas stutzeri]|uniref:GntR family transcriptional regulator n=1 Tax=Stutzerimonas stutzeri TaxID=316 RepID=A0A2N8SNZ2_STUST|nr:S1-like domain-containing RNA-binding protein [Stutzerimonas stutzeri]MCQ4248674.1 S1-like domain-containing RNA-binding protein [Stutzerimonas stutzeri]PNG04208.1 GntR family transcriptional regulator [Stutzerimonas stutzeri]
MAAIGRFNSMQIVKHTGFGLYLDGGPDGEILLPNRYIPKNVPTEVDDWLNVFVYLDSEDKLIATTEKPKVQVGEFASLKVVEINRVGIFLDWGLPKDLLLPHSEEKRQLNEGDYCVVHVYLDKHTRRITATARLDRYLDKTPARYKVGEAVDLLVVEATDLGHKAIINGRHWGLIHKNEAFKFLRGGMREKGYIKEVRADGKISLSLQPVGSEAGDALQALILQKLEENQGTLAVSDKSAADEIARLFGVSKGNFKKAIGGLYKQGRIVIHPDRIERA